MVKKHYFISFIGGIGAGKTTAAKLIAKHLAFSFASEKFRENYFLPLFYKDMRRWAFHSQLFFLVVKINQLLHIKKVLEKKSVVQDFSIYQDVFAFIKAQQVLGNFTKKDYAICKRVYDAAEKVLPRPDLLVYLKWSSKDPMSQIKKRGRFYEKEISLSYLNLLQKLQKDWVAKNSKKFNILAIDTAKLNFAKNPRHKNEFIKLVKKHLKK